MSQIPSIVYKYLLAACRRVSDAHVRSQLPYNDGGSSSQDEQQDPDDGREVSMANLPVISIYCLLTVSSASLYYAICQRAQQHSFSVSREPP